VVERGKVLIAPVGSGMAMSALRSLSVEGGPEIIVADSDPLAPGLHIGLRSYVIPTIDDEAFFSSLEKIIRTENVNVFIPCLDPFLIPVARNRAFFEKLGVKVMISPAESLVLSRDKWKTYIGLKDKIPMPESWINPDEIPDDRYPLFIKPRDGSGSINAYRVDSKEELSFYMKKHRNMIVQEYLPGREFTVDCLTDENGKLLISSPRERIKTKAGICTISRTVEYPELDEIASRIVDEVAITGPFFFQAKEDREGNPKVTELNIRLAGTMSLSTAAGVNIPLLAIKILLGEKIQTKPRPKRGVYLMRFWNEIFLNSGNDLRFDETEKPVEQGQKI